MFLVKRKKTTFFCRKLANTRLTKKIMAFFAPAESLPSPATLALFQNKYQTLKKFWVFFWEKMHSGQKNTFRLNVKTAVSPYFCCHSGSFFDGPDAKSKMKDFTNMAGRVTSFAGHVNLFCPSWIS